MIQEPWTNTSNNTPTYNTLLMDAAGEQAAYIVRAPKAGNIRNVHVRANAVTTATDSDFRVETVSLTTGLPTGTLWAANTNVTVAAASITANTWIRSGDLTASAVVARRDLLAVVVTPTGTPNYELSTFAPGGSPGAGFPYAASFTSGAWGKIARVPVVALEYDDGSFDYMPGVLPASALNTHSFNSSSTPDEIAAFFQFPVPVRLAGVWLWVDSDNDFDVVVYNGAGTEVETAAEDADVDAAITPHMPHFVWFAASEAQALSTNFRISIRPTTTANIAIYSFDVHTAAILDQMAGGQLWHHSTRTDGGAWTQLTTRRLFMGIIVDGLDDGVAGGGGSYQHSALVGSLG
jgi:hypothetical protein